MSTLINKTIEERSKEELIDLLPRVYEPTIHLAINIAIKALEKQIYKKPKKRKNQYIYECPVCGVEAHDNYCRYCGQRLDWR